jgi:ubiquitin-like 1-activating enzyme E1 A
LGEKLVEKHGDFIREFARTYGLDYCPVYSVIGSIISQEVIKVVESKYNAR